MLCVIGRVDGFLNRAVEPIGHLYGQRSARQQTGIKCGEQGPVVIEPLQGRVAIDDFCLNLGEPVGDIRLFPDDGGLVASFRQVAVQATVNGHAYQTVAEPDGESGHWVRIDAKQQRAAALVGVRKALG